MTADVLFPFLRWDQLGHALQLEASFQARRKMYGNHARGPYHEEPRKYWAKCEPSEFDWWEAVLNGGNLDDACRLIRERGH